jgi:hypothetical protein
LSDVPQFIHPSTKGHLACFWQVLEIMNKTVINIHVQAFVHAYIFNSFGKISMFVIAGLYGKSMTNFVRNHQPAFQIGPNTFHSHW